MPSSILTTDTMFPQLRDGQTTDEKFGVITNYLYMLREQLTYSMANMGRENFNDQAFEDITTIITQPVLIRIEDAEGNLSRLTQTVDSIDISVENGTESSEIMLMKDGIVVRSREIRFSGMVTFLDLAGNGTTVINGGNIKTGTISAIDISGCTVEGSVFKTTLDGNGNVGGEIEFYYLNDSYLAGGIRMDNQGAGTSEETRYRIFLYTQSVGGVAFALKLQSAGGISMETSRNIYAEAATTLTLNAPVVRLNGGGQTVAQVSSGELSVNGNTYFSGNVYINGQLVTPSTPVPEPEEDG